MSRKRCSSSISASAHPNRHGQQQIKRQKVTKYIDGPFQGKELVQDQSNDQTYQTQQARKGTTDSSESCISPCRSQHDLKFDKTVEYRNSDSPHQRSSVQKRLRNVEYDTGKVKTCDHDSIVEIIKGPISDWGHFPTEADKQAWIALPVFNRPYFWENVGGMVAWYGEDNKKKQEARKQAALAKARADAHAVAAAKTVVQPRRSTRPPKPSAHQSERHLQKLHEEQQRGV